jgi:hypothetical protein
MRLLLEISFSTRQTQPKPSNHCTKSLIKIKNKNCRFRLRMFYRILFLSVFICNLVFAQNTTVVGKLLDSQSKEALPFASVYIDKSNKGVSSNEKGVFRITFSNNSEKKLIIKSVGYVTKNITINPFEGKDLDLGEILLEKDVKMLSQVEIKSNVMEDTRNEAGVTKINPQTVKALPSVFGDFNKILSTLPGVVSNNELSSTYSVRGGNFDENLVYVNDMEIYRPFLVRSGQQEGLSFVNPDLVSDITFSSGGWQAKYGDKLSSVLDVQYKTPKKFAGSTTLGVLGGSIHLEGISKNQRVSHVTGFRHRQARYAFNFLPTKGTYQPSFSDFQSFVNIDLSKKEEGEKLNKKTTLGILTSYSRNRYLVIPEFSETSFGTINRVLRVNIAFDGKENMDYDTYQSSFKLQHRFSERFLAQWIASGIFSTERENTDIEAGYRLCDVNPDPGSDSFNKCVFVRGVGTLYDHRRNRLNVSVLSMENKYTYVKSERSTINFGVKYNYEMIEDVMKEWMFVDSSDHIKITSNLRSQANLASHRFSGFIQNAIKLDSIQTLTYGIRFNYWSLNKQLLISPRIQYSIKPRWRKDVVFRLATGIYQQPAFYRELRDYDGNINTQLKAQRSYHFVAGTDYNFKLWNRDFKFIAESYFKYIENAVAYDVDNVRIRYFANNDAKAYATGADFRVSGEFIKGAESWFSLGILQTKEDLKNDFFRVLANPTDANDTTTVLKQNGWVRRPTDQRLTASIFFQDNLPKHPSIKVFLNLIFGTGLPFGPPRNVQFRSALTAPSYRRVDIGFSKLLSFSGENKAVESVWIGLEVLNVIGVNNTISYLWIKDVYNVQYAIPNYLSQRFLNAKIIVRF